MVNAQLKPELEEKLLQLRNRRKKQLKIGGKHENKLPAFWRKWHEKNQ